MSLPHLLQANPSVMHERDGAGRTTRKPRPPPPPASAGELPPASARSSVQSEDDPVDLLERARRRAALLDRSSNSGSSESLQLSHEPLPFRSSFDLPLPEQVLALAAPPSLLAPLDAAHGGGSEASGAATAAASASASSDQLTLNASSPHASPPRVAVSISSAGPGGEAAAKQVVGAPPLASIEEEPARGSPTKQAGGLNDTIRVTPLPVHRLQQPALVPLNAAALRTALGEGAKSPAPAPPLRSIHHFCMEEHKSRLGGASSSPTPALGADMSLVNTRAMLGRDYALGRRAVMLPKIDLAPYDARDVIEGITDGGNEDGSDGHQHDRHDQQAHTATLRSTSSTNPAESQAASPGKGRAVAPLLWTTEVIEPPKSYYHPQEVTEYLAPLYVTHGSGTLTPSEAVAGLEPPETTLPAWLASAFGDGGGGGTQGQVDASLALDGAGSDPKSGTLTPAQSVAVSSAASRSVDFVVADGGVRDDAAADANLDLGELALLSLIPTMVHDLPDNATYGAVMGEVAEQRGLWQQYQTERRDAQGTPPPTPSIPSQNGDGSDEQGKEDNPALCAMSLAGAPALHAAAAAIESLVQPYREAVDRTPIELAITFGYWCRRQGRLHTARKFLDAAAAAKPPNLEAHWQRCLLHLVEGNLHAALGDLAVITRDGRFYKGFRARADIYLEQGFYMDALTNYDLAILLYDRDPDAYFQRATAYAALNEVGLASQDLHAGILLNPNHAGAIRRRAATELHLGHFSLAISLFSDAVRLDPEDKDSYLQRAICHHKEGQFTEAVRDLCQCIHLDPTNHLAFFWRGCLLRECHPRRALKDLGVSLLLDDGVDNIATYLNRGILYVQLKQHQQAITDFRCVLRLDQASAARTKAGLSMASVTAHLQLGLVHLQHLGKPAIAARSFSSALAVDPSNLRAILCRAECYTRIHAKIGAQAEHALKLAMRDYVFAIHLQPSVADYRALLGHVLLKMGRHNEACRQLRLAAGLDPRFVGNLSVLARVHSFNGDHEAAIALLREQCVVLSGMDPLTTPNDALVASTAVAARARKMVPTMLLLARVMMRARRYADAVRVLESALVLQERDVDLLVQYGVCLVHQQRYGEAKEALNRAITVNSRSALAFFYRGFARLHLREDKGIQDVNTALALDSTLWQAYLTRACYYALVQRHAKAVLNCNEALRLQPRSARTLLVRGCVKMQMHHYAEALADLTAAIRLEPASGLALYNRGLCHQYMGRHRQSVRDLSVALLLDSGAPPHAVYLARGVAHYRLGDYTNALLDLVVVGQSAAFQLDARILHSCALCRHHSGRLEQAVGEYTQALQQDPLLVAALVGRGNALMDHLTPEAMVRSRRDYVRAIHLAPTQVEAYLNLALNLQAGGQLQQAWQTLTAALRFAPRDAGLLEARAVVSLQQSRFAAALLDLTEAIERPAPPSAELLTNRGVVHQYMRRPALAVADFRAALAADPGCALAHYNLATVLLHHKQLPQALEHLDRAVALSPADEGFRINRSVARVMAKDAAGALADLDAAATLSPRAIHVVYNRACVHAALGHWAAALDDLTAFLREMPMDVAAYEKRAKILGQLGRRTEALEDYSRAAAITCGAY